jgi:hypothetical protein
MLSRRQILASFAFSISTIIVGCQSAPKSYMRNPLVRELRVAPGPVSDVENSTPADPYPPPRPILPDEPSSVANVPMIQTPERTMAP